MKGITANRRQFCLQKSDFIAINNWHQNTKHNYFNIPLSFEDKGNYLHFTISLSRIILLSKFINKNLLLLNNLNPNGLIIMINIFHENRGCFIGKTYQRKGVECMFSHEQQSILFKQLFLYFYFPSEMKKQQLVIQLQLISQSGLLNQLGNLKFQLITPKKPQNTKISIQRSSQIIGSVQILIDPAIFIKMENYLLPYTIIDEQTQVSPLTEFKFKQNNHNMIQGKQIVILQVNITIILEKLIQLLFNRIEVQIQKISSLLDLMKRIGPYQHLHFDMVNLQVNQYTLWLGCHNQWRFIKLPAEKYLYSMMKQSEQSEQLILKCKESLPINKITFKGTIFIAMLSCKVCHSVKGQAIERTSVQIYNLGWLPIIIDLDKHYTTINQLLIDNVSIPGHPIHFKDLEIKLLLQVQHPKFQKYQRKRIQQVKPIIKNYDNLLPDAVQIGFGNSVYKYRKSSLQRSVMIPNSTNYIQQQEKYLKSLIQKMSTDIKPNRMHPNGQVTFRIESLQQSLITRPKNDMLIGKQLSISIQLQSIIPYSDNPQNYSIPTAITINLYLLRNFHQLSAQLQINSLTFGVPCSIKYANKNSIVSNVHIENLYELEKLYESNLVVKIQDQYNLKYAKGLLPACNLLFKSQLGNQFACKIPLYCYHQQAITADSLGILVIIVHITIAQFCNSKKESIPSINQKNILGLLSTSQRQKMRINNYQGRQDETAMKAIKMYRLSNQQNVLDKVRQHELDIQNSIQYQIGIQCYHFYDFKNENSSQNNQFTFYIDVKFIQLVTDTVQYAHQWQKCYGQKYKQTYKLTYNLDDNTGYYQCKIPYQKSFKILIKILRQDWSKNISKKHILHLKILRNNFHTKTYKCQIICKQPLIHDVIFYEDFKTSKITAPVGILKESKIIPMHDNAKYENNTIIVEDNMSSHLQILLMIINFKKIVYILLQIKLIQGRTVKVNLGQLYLQSIRIPFSKKNKCPLYTINISDESHVVKQLIDRKKIRILNGQQTFDIPIRCLQVSNQQNSYKIIVNCIDLQNNKLYEFLIKIQCSLSVQPEQISSVSLNNVNKIIFNNPYAIQTVFTALSSQINLVIVDPNQIIVQSYGTKIIKFMITAPLYTSAYVIIYNQYLLVVQMYQIQPTHQINHQILNRTIINNLHTNLTSQNHSFIN